MFGLHWGEKLDLETLQSNLVFLQTQQSHLQEALNDIHKMLNRFIVDYDAALRNALFIRGTADVAAIEENAKLETTIVIDKLGERLEKVEELLEKMNTHMALVAIKVPDLNEGPVERPWVKGDTSERLSAIGRSETGSAPAETGSDTTSSKSRRTRRASAGVAN